MVTGRRLKRAVSISIYSDRQSFIKSTSTCATGSGQCLINEFHPAADNSPGQLNLRWISGHSNVLTGNERADELAKQAAQEHSSPTPDLPSLLRQPLPRSASADKQSYQEELIGMWREQWQYSPRCARIEVFDKQFPSKTFSKLQNTLTPYTCSKQPHFTDQQWLHPFKCSLIQIELLRLRQIPGMLHATREHVGNGNSHSLPV